MGGREGRIDAAGRQGVEPVESAGPALFGFHVVDVDFIPGFYQEERDQHAEVSVADRRLKTTLAAEFRGQP